MEGSMLIDVSRLVDRAGQGRLPTGVDRVCLAYIQRFGTRAQAVLRWHSWRRILPYKASQRLFELVSERAPSFRADVRRTVAQACIPPWPSQDGRGRIYFNHGHSGAEDAALWLWLRQTRQRPVYMVHDLIPVTHPEYCRPGEREKHESRLRTVLTSSAGVLTNSRHTAAALARFAQREGLPSPPVAAVPLGPARLARSSQSAPLRQPYFVMLGTIEPRKNHWLMLHVWRELVAELGAAAPHLVIIGQRGWECENVVDLLERCESLRGVVHELSGCDDEALVHWLQHAQALLFPSFAEGYGMPLVEALALGTPVIASQLPAFREAAGDVPEYLNPLDGPAWRRAVLDFAAGYSPRREASLQRLTGFQCPSWDAHFGAVEAFMERLS